MIEPAATFNRKTGELAYRGFWRSRNDMEKQALAFEQEPWPNSELARQCRQALAAYDAFHGEDDA
jgi:hypothetical protein